MNPKRQATETANRPVKKSKVPETSKDDWLVPSKCSFDCTANSMVVIGPPLNFHDSSFNDLSYRLVMGDLKLSMCLVNTLAGIVLKHDV